MTRRAFIGTAAPAAIGEGRAAIKAARRHDRIVQMGTQQRSWEHYRQAVGVVRSGVLGDISNVEVFPFRVGRRVKWNPETEQVEGDAGANALVTKRYRPPWSLPA